jgi:serine/threonine-protein kinase
VGVVLAALVAAGTVVAIREKVFTPSHPVPALAGMTVAGARQALVADHFTLVEATPVYSTSVPAGAVVSQDPAAHTSLKEGSSVRIVPSSGLPPEQIPSLLGLNCAGAQRLLATNHLIGQCPDGSAAYNSSIPVGQVINWSFNNQLNATSAPWGSTVVISLSKGPAPVTVPSYAGSTYSATVSGLQALGLQATESQQQSPTVPAGQVIGTSPGPGQVVPVGTTVTVVVSTGPPTAPVPDVEGQGLAAAQAAIKAAGFTVGTTYGPNKGKVFSEIPAPGTQQPLGTAITLYIM